MRAPFPVLLLLLLGSGCATTPPAAPEAGAEAEADALPTLAEATEGTRAEAGLLTLHLDEARGRVLLELPPAQGPRGEVLELLLVEGLRTGVGSNPIGLDRGQWGEGRLVVIRRVGRRVLLEQPNLRFRALTDDPDEVLATRESFATSVLWAAPLVAEDEDGRGLVDLTSFVVRDAHGTAATLAATGQGRYALDPVRSLAETDACLAFPDNVELEATLTFAGEAPGALVASTTPDPRAVTVVQHLSLVRLPDDGYTPREADPRGGAFGLDFLDLAAPLGQTQRRRLAVRHRLGSRDPGPAPRAVVEPIVYYVDRGAPEPVRGALLDGARWWSRAFLAAGFRDAFQVELLPEGIHPLDVRYNVIEWVHRSTRGWSYGHTITDPRTGEILKGHVSLGSQRVRQDQLLFEGLLGTAGTGSGRADDPLELALARIRQLAAHEVGHTLGLAHNFAASQVFNGSVMDYPAPHLDVVDGRLVTDRAYGVGVGPWDEAAIRWLYAEAPVSQDEQTFLEDVLAQARRDAPPFLSDADARPLGSSHPAAHLWDTGADPVAALERTLRVRAWGLDRFGTDRAHAGAPMARLQEVFAPLYFHHRYQLEATLKLVGGVDYEHGVIPRDGSPGPRARPVPAHTQRRALQAVVATLDPALLDLSDETLALLLPPPPGEGRGREMVASATAPAFDAPGAAATAARLAVTGLVHPARCARLLDQHRRDPDQLGLDEVLESLLAGFEAPPDDPRQGQLALVVERVVVDALLDLTDGPPGVRAVVEHRLRRLAEGLADAPDPASLVAAHRAALAADITRRLERPDAPGRLHRAPAAPPPGSPIGLPSALGCSLDEGR